MMQQKKMWIEKDSYLSRFRVEN